MGKLKQLRKYVHALAGDTYQDMGFKIECDWCLRAIQLLFSL